MNSDQIKGKAKDIGGKVQEEFGKAVGSSEQRAKGLANQVEGKTQKKLGDVEDAVDDTLDRDTLDKDQLGNRGNRQG